MESIYNDQSEDGFDNISDDAFDKKLKISPMMTLMKNPETSPTIDN